jgi:hypothetical protein
MAGIVGRRWLAVNPANRCSRRFERRPCQGRKEDAGARMLADKFLLLAGTVAVVRYDRKKTIFGPSRSS